MARIGIFGGTFDPVHIGHLVAAVNARHAAGLDEVWLVPAREPWQKVANRPITPAEVRYEAVEAAVAGHAGLQVSAIEIDRAGETYTVDTIDELLRRHPEHTFTLIMGADTANGIETWRGWERIAEAVDVVVVNRPGVGVAAMNPAFRVTPVTIPALAISSTDLRERLADGRPVDYLIPDAAAAVFRTRANGQTDLHP